MTETLPSAGVMWTPPLDARLALRQALAAMPEMAVFNSEEAATYCGMGHSTWARMRKAEQTPAAMRLNNRTLGYRKSTLDAWLDARLEQRTNEAPTDI